MHNYLKAIANWAKVLSKRTTREPQEEYKLPDNTAFCHKDKVHIFVRGLADNKLHSAKNRNHTDVRFYKKENLKVFCAVCRKRIM